MRPLLLLALAGCPKTEPEPEVEPSPLLDVDETGSWQIEGLSDTVHVVYTEGGIPHIYGASEADVAAVHGFIAARDRFLQIDLARRLGQATLSELVGDAALETDIEAAQSGVRVVTDNVMAALTDEQVLAFEGYARGVNAWMAAVQDGSVEPPSEYATLAPLLGHAEVSDMLDPFDARDVAAVVTTFVLQAGFSDREVGWTRAVSQLDGLYDDAALGDLRQAGVWDDVWNRVDPIHGTTSVPVSGRRSAMPALPPLPVVPSLPDSLLARAEARSLAREKRWHHDTDGGWGSNAWAVMGSANPDGLSMLAGDGHLDLSSPSIVWSVSMDTTHLGGEGGTHVYGVTSPGLPTIAAGTNGRVAWSSTQPFADINDQYREEIELDADGAPVRHRFQGDWLPLQSVDDTFVVQDVALLGSTGRTETWTRYVLSDGRLLVDIEGREVNASYTPAAGETVVNMSGTRLVPEDTDGDGVITGLSFDFTGLDEQTLTPFFEVNKAQTVEDFAEVLTHTAALSQNFVVSDATGSVMYTQFQAMPCRGYLDRDADGSFAPGANPRFVLDGTRYGGFTIPFTSEGRLDFDATEPERCVIAPQDYPSVIDPAQGFVLSANNDPSGLSLDSNVENDAIYIGGPWEDDYRAHRIETLLTELVDAGESTVATMAETQADHRSALGAQFVPLFLEAIEYARDLDENTEFGEAIAPSDGRILDAYRLNQDVFDEVESRLTAWQAADYDTPSGVDTSYDPIQPGDEANAVATMIFNAWLPRYSNWIIADERFPGSLLSTITGATGRTRVMTILHDGRGEPGLASYNPNTGESAFFDRLGTPEVETSREGMLLMMLDAVTFLSSESTEPGKGGFGTDDMDQWLWGLRHWAHFPSLLGSALGSDGALGPIAASFDINARDVPIADDIGSGDPRRDIPGWPRHGDALNIDSGNPGWSGTHWDYDFGPSFRMVIGLGEGTVTGQNILPGGQSAILDDPHYSDQVPLWLANEALAIHWTVDDVAAAGIERHVFQAP